MKQNERHRSQKTTHCNQSQRPECKNTCPVIAHAYAFCQHHLARLRGMEFLKTCLNSHVRLSSPSSPTPLCHQNSSASAPTLSLATSKCSIRTCPRSSRGFECGTLSRRPTSAMATSMHLTRCSEDQGVLRYGFSLNEELTKQPPVTLGLFSLPLLAVFWKLSYIYSHFPSY